MKEHNGMKPQDIPVLLYIFQYANGIYKVSDVAHALKISQSEVSESINRSRIAKLIETKKKTVFPRALFEFLVYGLKYVFPVIPGALVRGVATAHSAPPLSTKIVKSSENYVWPYAKGRDRGMAVKPLYKTLPQVCAEYPEFYELMALIDALRLGRRREVNLARSILKKRLLLDE